MLIFNYFTSRLQGFIQTHPMLWVFSITVLTGGLAALWYGAKFLYSFFKKKPANEASFNLDVSSMPRIINRLIAPGHQSSPLTLHSLNRTDESEAILMAEKLLSQGCSLAERNFEGDFANTPLLEVIAAGKFNLAHLYIQHIIQYNQPAIFDLQDQESRSQNTALILAIMQGQENIALDIIRGGANIHIAASEGFTALHYACMLRLKPVIVELLNRGANPLKPNTLGVTPSDYYLYDFPFNPNIIVELSRLNGRVVVDADSGPIFVGNSDGTVLKDVNHIGHHQGMDSLFNGSRAEKEAVLIERLGISNPEEPTAFSRRASECYRISINNALDNISQTPISLYCFPATLSELFDRKFSQHLFSLERSHLENSEQELNNQAILLAKEETCNEFMASS